MSNIVEFKNHRLVDTPYKLKCKVCGQDMIIPMSGPVWTKHGSTIEANMKEFKETHEKCRAPQK